MQCKGAHSQNTWHYQLYQTMWASLTDNRLSDTPVNHTEYQSNVWAHLLIQGFFLIFYYFLHSSNYEITHMESCSTQKSVKQIKIDVRFFNVDTLCLDDSVAHSWHSLNQLHLESFSNNIEGVPINAEHLLASFPSLCSPTYPKPSQLGWGRVIVEARSSNSALHHSPSWSNSPYIARRCVLGHCPVEKQMIVPLSPNQMGWCIAADCCGSHAG